MKLTPKTIDWGRNPAVTRESIESNFKTLFDAFNELSVQKLDGVSLSVMDSDRILSGSTDLSSIFVSIGSIHDLIRIVAGKNVTTGGTENRPIINVSDAPSFAKIMSGVTDLSDLFLTKSEAKLINTPDVGNNIEVVPIKGKPTMSVVSDPEFKDIRSRSITFESGKFNDILYKGRPLEEFLPSYKMSDGTPYLRLRAIDWGKNPAMMRDDIDSNFRSIIQAFNSLLEHKLDGVELRSLNALNILSGSTPLSSIFMAKDDDHDVVRIACGQNIVTGGTQNRPIIGVSTTPVFTSITGGSALFSSVVVNGRDISDIYYTKEEGRKISHPGLGKNLRHQNGDIHVVDNPSFSSISTEGITANTFSVERVTFCGRPLESWFGSHTFVQGGKNIITGGTDHNPVLSVVHNPDFSSIRSISGHIVELTATTMVSDRITAYGANLNELTIEGMVSIKSGDISLNNDLHLHNGCITMGIEPDREVSSFLRTKLRVMASDSSPIHYAIIAQNNKHLDKRVLNDQSVDFVVRGDGNVGIGAFDGLSSKLTIKSPLGYDQLRLANSFTPKDSNDTRGSIGDIAWDDDYTYVRTSQGWRRSQLQSF